MTTAQASPPGWTSIVDLLRRRLAGEPKSELFRFLPDGEDGAEVILTAGELDLRARALAARLQDLELTGERALLLYPPGLEFIVAFFGCLYAQVVAVPAHLPRPNRPMPRLRSIVEDARPAVVMTCVSLQKDSARWSAGVPSLESVKVLYSDEEAVAEAEHDGSARGWIAELAERWIDPGVTTDTLAFLQYTSGSTATPRGVMITHGNLMDNSARIHVIFGTYPGGRGVLWLPPFHDMGLIGGVVQPVYCGGTSTLMSPVSFLQRPIRWLETISRTGAEISGGPNFAYDLCVEKTTPEQRAGLDLSRWRVAFCGAEPVRAETLERFAEAFAPAGFRPEAFLPCYGMAETTLLVSGNPTGRRPIVLPVDAGALGRGEVCEAVAAATSGRLVSCGRPAEGHVVEIVDPATGEPCPNGRVGEIWFAGPSAAQGYWGRPEESLRSMNAHLNGHEGRPFLRTGDLGFLHDGELFVTGRIKDMIILLGRNIYPQDVEWAAERCHPMLRVGGAAAFAFDVASEERLAIVIETERRLPKGAAEEILAAIRCSVVESLDVEVSAIRLIKPTSLPRTSSGKVQRHACREAFLAGTFETVAEWTRQELVEVPALVVDKPATRDAAAGPVTITVSGPPVPSRSSREIVAWLAAKVAEPLGIRPGDVDIRAPLAGFGVGSLQAVRLAAELEEWLGRKLSPTLVYDYPTIIALARFLAGESPDQAHMTMNGQARTGGREPIAIVGIGCRFPGASGPSAFWKLLREGVEAIGEVPDSRWSEQDLDGLEFPSRSGFLQGIDLFDAGFFNITRREAMFLDPQQRMLMEVAWEALEDAGQSPDRLAGTPVGVFIGISTSDYAFIQVKRGGAAIGHRITGNSGSIAANRISHFFDFRGPSLAIDTACSSSLVATLMACRSLWDGESDVALAGGSNILLQTQVFASFAKGGFLSPDGHCRAFDAEANGYVRGEGAAIVVLKPLSRALADGDAIYAVIRGGAVNQDGRTNGLTAPSGPAQEAVLRAAYRHAGLAPGEVGYVEAHGTGTQLGDPIELTALGAVLCEGRAPGRRCALGSVKTNIGHLEAAAGVAGLIKAALSLHHRTIPPSLNYSRPNPHVDLEPLPLRIAAGLEPWPAGEGPARAGVSAFGYGGTNAHLILEEAPGRLVEAANQGSAGLDDEDVVIPLSARTEEALYHLCRSWRDFLSGAPGEVDLHDLAYSAGTRRGHLEHRLALVVAGRDEALGALDAFLRGEPHISVVTGCRRPGLRMPPVFFFSEGIGIRPIAVCQLYRREPAFRAAIEQYDAAIGRELGWSLATALDGSALPALLEAPGREQPFRFAAQVALAALWESWGIVPGASVGEGLGAIAAAQASGRLDLLDAVKLLADPPGCRPAETLRDELAKLASDGHDVFIEIGGDPRSAATVRAALAEGRGSPLILSSLRGGDRGLESLRWSAASLYAAGFDIQWSRVSQGGRFVRLPNYPWRHERYWLDQEAPPPRFARSQVAIAGPEIPDASPGINGLPNGHHALSNGTSPSPGTNGLSRGYHAAPKKSIPAPVEAPLAHVAAPLAHVAAPAPAVSVSQRPDLVDYLRERVASLLGLSPDQLELDRPLTSIGLDSIFAMELKLDLDQSFGVKFPLSILIEGSSIRDVAERAKAHLLAEAAAAGPAETVDPSPMPDEASSPLDSESPLSAGQQMLWYEHQLDPESCAYNNAGAARLRASLDIEALRRSFQKLVDRHASLRTTFSAVDGRPVQRIRACMEVWFRAVDSSELGEAEIRHQLSEEARRPFCLETGPLFRAWVFSASSNDHYVLISVHHIVSDFWSIAVLMDELGRIYAAEASGGVADLPPVAFLPTDFVRLQAEALAGPGGDQLRAYWDEALGGELAVLNLPMDRPRSSLRTRCGATRSTRLGKALAADLFALGHAQGATPYVTLLAAFQALLARYAGQDDIIVGTPVAGRGHPGSSSTVGYFVNTLPMRSDLSGNPTFEEILGRVRRVVYGALEHQDYPFSMMVNRARQRRDSARTPIFQVMFAYQKAQRLNDRGFTPFVLREEGPQLSLGGHLFESVELDLRTALFDLTLTIAEVNGDLAASIEYDVDLFETATIHRMLDHFKALLAVAVSDPKRRLSDLSYLGERERAQILEWARGSNVGSASDGVAAVHEAFELQAAATPDATALVFEREPLTYSVLNRRANQLAAALRSLGVGPEVRVGLLLEEPVTRIVATLAVLKAGGAYVPFDSFLPAIRLEGLVQASGAAVLVVDHHTRDRAPRTAMPVLDVDEKAESLAQRSHENLCVQINGGNLAYVIFTSGSTGSPKGVMISHASLMNAALAWDRAYALRQTIHRHLQAASFSFDVFTGEWVRALTTGGTLVICSRETRLDPAAMADLVRRERVECLEIVPVLAEALASHLEGRGETLPGVKLLAVGGEKVSAGLYRRLVALVGSAGRVVNSYGLTETTVDNTLFEGTIPDDGQDSGVPIGRPMPGTSAYVLDRSLELVPPGIIGELYLGDSGVARGYLGSPRLTAERFIPDPFGGQGTRLFRTGDLARWRLDGTLECLGRVDDQIKIRGFRVELGEIEICLAAHPALRDAAVAAHEDGAGELRLTGYVVYRERYDQPTAAELRAWLLERLPEYMVPAAFVPLEALPLSPNGKVDRKALPAPRRAHADLAAKYVPPRGPIEEAVAELCAELLGIERAGAHDNLFELGGHSLIAIQLLARLRHTFHVEPPLRDFLDSPTVARLAQLVEDCLADGKASRMPSLTQADRSSPSPASFSQQRLWYLDQLYPGRATYNMPIAVRLLGRLDVVAMERALNEIVRRHEVLRTTFESRDGMPCQIIAESLNLPMGIEDLTGIPEEQRGPQSVQRIREEAHRPFDLARGPLVRAGMVRLGEQDHIVWVLMHHIVSDGWSMGVLVREFLALYDAFRGGEGSPLPEPDFQYADYAAWQRDWLRGQVLESQLDYWKRRLAGLSSLNLPMDHSRPTVPTGAGDQRARMVPRAVLDGARKLSREEGATLYMTLLAVFQTLLHRYTGQEDLAVGSPIAGRPIAELEGLIGLFVNTLVMRVDLSGDPRFRELLGRVRRTAIEAYSHQDLPFERLVEVLRPSREADRTPLFQVMFVLDNAPLPPLRSSDLVLEPLEITSGTSKFDLLLTAAEQPEGLSLTMEYSTELFEAATIDRMLGHFGALLEGAVADPERHLGELPLMSELEQEHLLRWSDSEEPSPQFENPDLEWLTEQELDSLISVLGHETGKAI